MNLDKCRVAGLAVSAGCHINDVMNETEPGIMTANVSAGCHINDVMNSSKQGLHSK